MIVASDWIAFHADRTPDKLAMIDQGTGRRFTYGEFNDRAARLAGYFRDSWGIRSGDRIAILAKNSTNYFEFEFACIKLGAIMLPLNWRLAEPELLFILNDAAPRGLVYDGEFAERIPGLAASPVEHWLRIDLGQPAADRNAGYEEAIEASRSRAAMDPGTTHETPMTIMYTSGTTGHPKGVIITHGMTFWNAINVTVPTGLNLDSVFYCVLPTFHTGGLNLYANPIMHLGGTNIIARHFDAGLTLQTLSDRGLGVTHMFGAPAIYLFMSQHEDFARTDLGGIESWGCGGAPMPASLLKQYAERGIVIQVGFGMTETSPAVFLMDKRRALDKPTSVGKPLLHTRARVVTENFEDAAPGQVGEVVMSGPNITPAYWNRPDANESSFTIDQQGHRWLHSGDAGMVDEEGCFYIVDRYKDMYLSGGENVYPAEVEQVIFQLSPIADVAVIGVPDERWGETGMAIVVLKPGETATPEEIIAHCLQNLAKYKVPKRVVFTDVLPRNASGKVLKRELRAQYAAQQGT